MHLPCRTDGFWCALGSLAKTVEDDIQIAFRASSASLSDSDMQMMLG